MGGLVPSATRALSRTEKVLVLRNQVEFLEEQVADMFRRIDLLVDDNAEIDYLAGLNARVRNGAMEDLYRANVSRIDDLRREIATANLDIALYKRTLVDEFGIE